MSLHQGQEAWQVECAEWSQRSDPESAQLNSCSTLALCFQVPCV